MLKKIIFFIPLFISCDLFASDDCSKFKFDVDVNINLNNNENININKSKENLVDKMGYIESGITYNARYIIVPIMVQDGFCVSLRSVDVDINFPAFNIVIDKRLKENSCAYNIVLQHEKDHMQSEKNVVKDNLENIKKSVFNAAQSINPIFVAKEQNQTEARENIYKQLETHKDVVDIIDKIKQELKQENDKIDFRGDSWQMWQCEDFVEEMKNSADNISID